MPLPPKSQEFKQTRFSIRDSTPMIPRKNQMQESLREEKFEKEFILQSSVNKRYLKNGIKTPQPQRNKDINSKNLFNSSVSLIEKGSKFKDNNKIDSQIDKMTKNKSYKSNDNANNTPNTFNKLIERFKITKKLVYEI